MPQGLLSFLSTLGPFVAVPGSPYSLSLPDRVESLRREVKSLSDESLVGHVQNVLGEIAPQDSDALRRVREQGAARREFWEQALQQIDRYLHPAGFPPLARSFSPSHLTRLGSLTDHWRLGDELPLEDPRCRILFGSKATGLATYRREGLPIPEFAVVDADLTSHLPSDAGVRQAFARALPALVSQLEVASGLEFGDSKNPLVLSVRSGMEGVEATIQGVGLNGQTTAALAERTGDERGALRRYLKFIIQYGGRVRRIPSFVFDEIGPPAPSLRELREQIARAKKLILRDRGLPFPEDPYQQLQEAMIAVASVWDEPHVVAYRRRQGIPDAPAAPLIVQRQVFGDVGDNSAALTFFSRNVRDGTPSGREGPDGRTRWYGELKLKASGDEVMAGSSQPPLPLHKLFLVMPGLYGPLAEIIERVETKNRGPVKGEVIIEGGRPWLLQVVTEPPMWAFAILRSAVDMYDEGLITREELKERVTLPVWSALKSKRYERPKSSEAFLLTGRSAAVGIGSGEVIFGYRRRPRGSRKGIFILDFLPREERERVLKRAAGIVALGDLGSHFYPQAARAGVPVLAQVREAPALLDRVKPGKLAWLDCSRPDHGYLTQVPLREKESDLARYMRGGIKGEDIKGDRLRLEVDYVNRYRAIMGIPDNFDEFQRYFEENFPRTDPIAAAQFTLMHDRVGIHETFLDWVTKIGWAQSRWVSGEGSYYSFAPEGTLFLRTLSEQDPRWYAHHLNDTTSGGHSVAVSAFQALSPQGQARVMDEMVAEVLEWGRVPGWVGGKFLLLRLIALMALESPPSAEVLNQLNSVTVRRLVEEFFYFTALEGGMSEQDPAYPALLAYLGDRYAGSRGPGRRSDDVHYLHDVRSRYPGLEPARWARFFASMESTKLQSGLEDPDMPPQVREWFQAWIYS